MLSRQRNEKKIPPSPADPQYSSTLPLLKCSISFSSLFLGNLVGSHTCESICREKYLLIIALNQNMLEMPGSDGMTEIKGFQMW